VSRGKGYGLIMKWLSLSNQSKVVDVLKVYQWHNRLCSENFKSSFEAIDNGEYNPSVKQ
jgi:hypothetical protein